MYTTTSITRATLTLDTPKCLASSKRSQPIFTISSKVTTIYFYAWSEPRLDLAPFPPTSRNIFFNIGDAEGLVISSQRR
jgi:hypothetical protein